MVMEAHDAPKCDMDCFIRKCVRFFHDKDLSLSFCIQFFMQHVSIVIQCALAFAIKKKIMLVDDVCSRPPILLDLTICM
jgi:hypothetical protein